MACSAVIALLPLSPALAASSVGATRSAPPCSWYGETDQRDVNIGAPDLDAFYWASPLPATAGTTATIHGIYPAARYFSFHAYDSSGAPTATIFDRQVKPRRGSSNPYRGRVVRHRPERYTVRVVVGRKPRHPAKNTMYVPAGSGPGNDVALLVYRVYVPTNPKSPQGGVPFPTVTVAQSGASVVQEGACSTTPPPFGEYVWSTAAATNYPEFAPTPTVAGAKRTPVWTRQFGSSLGNLQNAYLATTISRHYGDLVVIRGRAATFPNNRAGVPPYRRSDLRYWSFCVYDTNGEAGYGCAADYRTAVRHHHYTYVISDPGVRPANATARHGITWLPWGGTQSGAQVMMRNLLPAKRFHHAAENITRPRQNARARTIMGAYYPKAVYCAPTVFAAGGWKACLKK